MKRSTIIAVMAIVIVGLSFQASAGVDDQVEIVKWIQPPDMDNGFDLESQWDPTDCEPDIIKADDWMCPDGRPITDIHWWGSYRCNEPYEPEGFAILIYDDAVHAAGYPCPGNLLEDYYVAFGDAGETALPGVDSEGETVYEYSLYLPEDDWFHQDQGTYYWISIVAVAPNTGDPPIWGWHTGIVDPEEAEELDLAWAVTGLVDRTGVMPPTIPEGNPEEWAYMEGFDMAFALTTVPEPGTLALFGTAAVGLFAIRRKKK